ncbi:MAG TPA: EAL domain-containing protein [Jatrophihabitans sp.]|jgi:diguanylate cyclase (GGDEF)-like protein/PAS domain S-box-containing protein
MGADKPSSERAERQGAGLFGVLATIGLVLLVVCAEFVLLFVVYHRGDGTRREQVVAARLEGVAHGDLTPSALASARGDLARLRAAGLSADELAAVDHALAKPAPQPAALRTATAQLSRRLTGRSDRIDAQASLIYVGLLVGASLGWMFWFRRLVARHKDLQRRITAQEARSAGERRLAALVHNSSDVTAVLDPDSRISFVTPSALSVLGWTPDELWGRRWIDEIVQPEEMPTFVAALAGQRDATLTMQARHRDGTTIFLEGTLTNLLGDDSVGGLVLTARDVTARRAMEEQLTHHAFHDALTGLANRRLFTNRLEHAMQRRARDGDHEVVVLFFDLDDFKQINDSVGHGVGDEVLVAVAERLAQVLRPEDTAARLGGDEFAVLMEDSDLRHGRIVAERLQTALAEPIAVDGGRHTVAASIGLALADDDTGWEDVLRNADVAMYLAKDRGKAGIAIYEPALHAESLRRVRLQADLQRALRNEEFVLHFQPAVELRTGRIVGFEALVRWQRPDHGLVAPMEFIPEAERCGLIVPLGAWVLRTACQAAAQLQSGENRPSMSVNVAAEQLGSDDFVELVFDALAESGLPADRLCVEITETALMRDLPKIAERLTEVRARGVRVAVDDFGTGYSSLSYLSKLPVDVLKVDRSFVERVTHDEQDASVTQAILTMSSAMRLTTVAEGIEDDGQANWLVSANCAIGQGFLWSKPVPISDAAALLTRSSWAMNAGHTGLRPVEAASSPAELLVPHRAEDEDARAS